MTVEQAIEYAQEIPDNGIIDVYLVLKEKLRQYFSTLCEDHNATPENPYEHNTDEFIYEDQGIIMFHDIEDGDSYEYEFDEAVIDGLISIYKHINNITYEFE